jgi:hypothetical protein
MMKGAALTLRLAIMGSPVSMTMHLKKVHAEPTEYPAPRNR